MLLKDFADLDPMPQISVVPTSPCLRISGFCCVHCLCDCPLRSKMFFNLDNCLYVYPRVQTDIKDESFSYASSFSFNIIKSSSL